MVIETVFMAVLSLSVAQPVPSKPHIVFTLVDDWGFAEAGFSCPTLKASNFDMLGNNRSDPQPSLRVQVLLSLACLLPDRLLAPLHSPV